MLLGLAAPAAAERTPAQAQAPNPEEQELIDSLDLETLLSTPVDVWTPTKAPQKTHEAPSIISVVTREQIAVFGHRSLAEVLSHLLGFYVVDDHSTQNVAVRGTSGGLYSDSSIIKVLINGHPVSYSPTGGHWLGPELVPLTAVERIEIIRGPASALYGPDAFLAMINIQTRAREQVEGGSAWLGVGRAGQRLATDVDLTVGNRRGMVEALVAYRQTQQDLSGLALPDSSPAPQIPRYNLGARHAEGLDRSTHAALATLTLTPSPGRSLSAFGHLSAFDSGAEFGHLYQLAHGYNDRSAFSENRVSRWHGRAGLSYSDELTPTLSLSLRGAYFGGGTRNRNRLEVGSEYYYVRRRARFRGGELDGHVAWTPSQRFQLAGGASVFVDDERLPSLIAVAKRPIEGANRGEEIPSVSVYQGWKKFINFGAYLQSTVRAFDGRLGLTGGLRYDHHNVYGGELSRRLGLVGSLSEDLHVKLLHGSAFQAPSPFLLYAAPVLPRDVIGNPELRPQFVNTFELQIAWEAAPLTLSTDLVYNLISDKTEFIERGLNKAASNVLETATFSWESRAELALRDWVRAHVSFELSRTVIRTGQEGYVGQYFGNEGTIYPRMMVHGGIVTDLGNWPLRAAVLGSYIGSRRASTTNMVLAGGPYRLPPYFLLNANLATRGLRILADPDQEIALALSGRNLLGATGPTPGFSGVDYPIAPRTLLLQLSLTF